MYIYARRGCLGYGLYLAMHVYIPPEMRHRWVSFFVYIFVFRGWEKDMCAGSDVTAGKSGWTQGSAPH